MVMVSATCLLYIELFNSTGESAVGKSSLVLRFVKGQFHEYQESTIGGEGFLYSQVLQANFKTHLLRCSLFQYCQTILQSCLSPVIFMDVKGGM